MKHNIAIWHAILNKALIGMPGIFHILSHTFKPTTVFDGESLWTAYVPDGIWRIKKKKS
jgi:hypothetical protein